MPVMSNPNAQDSSRSSTVILVGGNGGMSDRYREVVEGRGLRIRHFEKKIPAAARHSLGRVAAVFVVVSMVSHSLRDHAKELASADAPVVYLRSASVSALRAAVDDLEAKREQG